MTQKDKILFIIISGVCLVFIGYILTKRYREAMSEEKDVYVSQNGYKIDTSKSHLRSLIDDLTKQQRIPKIIHQTYYTNVLDIEYQESCLINKHMNPEYEYRFYTDNDDKKYINTHYPQYLTYYNSLKPGAYKADFFRYLVLFREGGVYLDCKSSTIIPLRAFIKDDIGFVSFKDKPIGTIQISFIASIANHILLGKCIELCVNNIKNKNYGLNALDITGPQICGRAFNILLNKKELEQIKEGVYKNMDVDIIGSIKIIGENKYQVLCDSKGLPLVARTCGSYKDTGSNYYSNRWTLGDVFK